MAMPPAQVRAQAASPEVMVPEEQAAKAAALVKVQPPVDSEVQPVQVAEAQPAHVSVAEQRPPLSLCCVFRPPSLYRAEVLLFLLPLSVLWLVVSRMAALSPPAGGGS